MIKYIQPLITFIFGMLALLFIGLWFPTIGGSADTLHSQSSAMASTFWNWDVVSTGNAVKLFIMIVVIMTTLFFTAKAFLRARNS